MTVVLKSRPSSGVFVDPWRETRICRLFLFIFTFLLPWGKLADRKMLLFLQLCVDVNAQIKVLCSQNSIVVWTLTSNYLVTRTITFLFNELSDRKSLDSDMIQIS